MHLPGLFAKKTKGRGQGIWENLREAGNARNFMLKRNSFFRIFVVKNKAVLVLFLILFSRSHGRNAFFKQG